MLPDDFTYEKFCCAVGWHQLRPALRLGAHRWTLQTCCLGCVRCPAEFPVGSRPLPGWCDRGGHIMWTTRAIIRRPRRGCWWCGFVQEKSDGRWVPVSGQRHDADNWSSEWR